MSTEHRYARPTEGLEWPVPGQFDTVFEWEYEAGTESLRRLYQNGKRLQWDQETRIDWSQNLDPENPQGLPDEAIVIFDSHAPGGAGTAVYLGAVAEQLGGDELERGIDVFSRRSEEHGLPKWGAKDVVAPAPHRLYRAVPRERFVLNSKDQRIPVSP